MQRSNRDVPLSRRAICLGAAATALAAMTCRARAQDWPTRPVTVIVPYSPGGNTDMMAASPASTSRPSSVSLL